MYKSEYKTLIPKVMLLVAVISATIFAFYFVSVENVLAQTDGLESVQASSGLADASLPEIIGYIIKGFLSVLGIVFLVLIIYAGYLWMTAGGDAEQVEKAKKFMINAVVGLIIILASFAITSYIINAITGALDSSYDSPTPDIPVETLSGSLGSGALRDHYPERNDTDIARNTKIFVTFKDAMNIESFIDGYSTNGTPEDTTDDTVATGLNISNIVIYATEDGESGALTSEQVTVAFTDDLKTFVFDPPTLGSDSENVSYTVYLDDNIEDSDGSTVLNTGGYEWSFEVSTEIDLTPPTVKKVTPVANGEYDRNIAVQITFSEAVDPTSATGTRASDSGFDNIQTYGEDDVPIAGEYVISNNYKTITFTSTDACGTNSCGDTIYCLPGGETVGATIKAATPGDESPQVDVFPYDGIVDTAGNALDSNGDGTAGDDYEWSFKTTNDVNLDPAEISTISPNIKEGDIDLDTTVYITFDSVMLSSTLTSENISLESNPVHELWYKIANTDEFVTYTQAYIRHGVFLESSSEEDGTTYLYGVTVTDGVKNEYQNCFVPGEGPDATDGRCGTTSTEPYCCNGSPSDKECSLF